MLNELALTCSSDGSYVWDFRAGTVVLSLRQNNSSKHAIDLVPYSGHAGRVGLLLCAQSDRAVINVYSWQKVSLIRKSVASNCHYDNIHVFAFYVLLGTSAYENFMS